MRIEVERVEEDGLKRQLWRFDFVTSWGDTAALRLEQWQPQERLSRRHKWAKTGEGWQRRFHNSHHHHGFRMPAAEVPFPADVVEEATAKAIASIKVEGAVDPEERP